jgi:hypothetical protein
MRQPKGEKKEEFNNWVILQEKGVEAKLIRGRKCVQKQGVITAER